ncbi:MAG: alpha-2-macroglobulin family protein, partial [Chitinophagales bacterium]
TVESDRGGFGIHYAFVKNNRIFSGSQRIDVPWTNKELKISYTSFRDKTLPGSGEKWKLRLSGYQRDKVTAEILAAMYDASLDQFMPHYWGLNDLFSTYYQTNFWQGIDNFFTLSSIEKFPEEAIEQSFQKRYDRFIFFNSNYHIRHFLSSEISIPGYKMDLHGAVPIGKTYNLATHASIVSVQRRKEISPEEEKLEKPTVPGVEANFQSQIQIRKNFNETAFFLPDLRTDDSGNVEFSFTMPEALTQWKWMSLAHTKDLAFGYSEKTIITQKELMVQPNPPRFIRQGDHLELPVKIVNLSDTEMTGQVQLQLIDPTSNQPVDGWFSNRQPNQYFTAASKQSTSISFPIDVPHVYDKPLTYRIVARTGAEGHELSDGEESILPVLSNRILVTESLPLAMKGPGSKKFSFDKLLKSGNSESLSQHALTIEFSGNPAWYAAESLPYLVEFPYECAEQTFERFYANALASLIANSSSRLKSVFEKWKNDSSVLLSNLEKNQELKSVLLQETPWVMEAKSESEQKKNIALLFDLGGMSCKLVSAFNKLRDMQSGSGGFPWFPGGPTDRYITQYILSGIGHLRKLGSISPEMNARINLILMPALAYADKKISDDYQALKKRNAAIEKSNFLENFQIQYLYLRSFFPEYPIPSESKEAVEFFRKQSRQYWLQQNKYLQGMIALALYRSGDGKTASGILSSLKQNAIHNEELGMYWKEMNGAYYWWQCPVESQALLIEAFSEIGKDNESVNDLKLWLLRQKQVQHWPTTKSTADACYALLLQGSDWLSANPSLHIRLGNQEIVSSGESGGSDGIGYLKKSIDPAFIKPEMGNISVSLTNLKQTNPQPAWGSAYWQYFEDMDQVTQSMQGSNPLKISKKLFVRKNTDKGPVLSPVPENGYLKVGDKITVRIELRSDRDLEYVHLKDMRASCMEPVNVLSGYKWQDGLGYYESTRDASSNFFFSWLTKGTHVFEYDLYVSQSGSFSNGIAKIQCMYAPEFTSHSEGLHINVENKE